MWSHFEFEKNRFKKTIFKTSNFIIIIIILVKRVLGRGPELREPNKAVLCPLIIIIFN
jgi:hypothetical protein